MSIIEVEALEVSYPNKPAAVRGVTFRVPSAGVLGLLGGNGAGKSSTMKAIAGVIPASAGRVIVNGQPVTVSTTATSTTSTVGYCPDVEGLPPQLTVAECVGVVRAATRRHTWDQALNLVERLNLTDVLNRTTSGFSHGMSRRLSVLLAVLAADKVLLLDEPFDGVDPNGARVIGELIAEHRARGGAAIVSTHLLPMASAHCDQIAVMSHGRIIAADHARRYTGLSGHTAYENLLARAQVTHG